MKEHLIQEIESTREYLLRSLRVFTEEDSGFAPFPGMFTVAQQVAHIADTAEWLKGGMVDVFDNNFAEHDRRVREVTSLNEAIARFNKKVDDFKAAVANSTEEHLKSPFSSPPLQGPRSGAILGFIDHTGHHRGALTVYARALGRTPVMPYMDM